MPLPAAELPRQATLIEVGLRDGLQNEPVIVPVATRVALAEALLQAGIREMEAGAMVHPRWVPQMAGAEEMLAALQHWPGVRLSALAPNIRGAERALACPLQEVRFSVITSETYSMANWNMSVAESLGQVQQAVARVRQDVRPLRAVGMVSAAFGCPYEGSVAPAKVLGLVAAFAAMGVDGVVLCDSAGLGNPRQVQELVARVQQEWPDLELTMHFHNTRGLGLANVLACLQLGVDRFDTSVGGLGGCPFAPGASGNICTVDTAFMLEQMGVATGIDLNALIAAAHLAEQVVSHPLPGMVQHAGCGPAPPGQGPPPAPPASSESDGHDPAG